MHCSIGIGLAITFLAALELFLLYDADPAHQSKGAAPGPN
jgi:hypothetical protein